MRYNGRIAGDGGATMNTRERGADSLAGWLRGRDPRGAWEHMRHTLDTNGPARALILTLAGTLEGRLALERSRRIWACHGLPAPFDDLLRRSEEHTSELQSRRDLVCRL